MKLTNRQRTLLQLIQAGANVPHGTINETAEEMQALGLLTLVKVGSKADGVSYALTDAGIEALRNRQ